MDNILLKYMVERFSKLEIETHKSKHDLPFITLSREYGCPAKEVAQLLVKKMNEIELQKNISHPWRLISKEILEATSQELFVDKKRIEKFYNVENRTAIDEILNSLSEKYYKSDKKIQNTLKAIITDFARMGNVVIVGRAGVCVTNHFKNGIHIRLNAPLEWRAERLVEKKFCDSLADAKKMATDYDLKRTELLRIMSNNTFNESCFDLTFNCQTFSIDEIVDSILYHLSIKGKLKN
ncbi:MAG: cytidylate kinase-like family protein [Bacteroidetes bacterium]|nr:cytidylate kinase-like family protein [Bacteroidota bacterium]